MPASQHASPLTGELSLCIHLAIQTKRVSLLKESLRELGQCCTESEAKWALSHLKNDLTPDESLWFDGALKKIWHDPENQLHRAVNSYVWQKFENSGLPCLIASRLNVEEHSRLIAIANATGKSKADLVREAVRRYIESATHR